MNSWLRLNLNCFCLVGLALSLNLCIVQIRQSADGSFLAVDTQNNSLVNVKSDASGTVPTTAKFQVIDLGKGRVELKAANRRFVSAAEEAAVLNDLARKTPGNAESSQWINLIRGETMLMSLTNHRSLATKPNEPGPVTITATGPRPAREGGECFKWKLLD